MSALPAGYAHGIDGPLEVSRWCPKCQDLVLARDDQRCSWCDTPTTPAAGERGALMAISTETRTCKIDDCINVAEDASGPYARLYLKHKEAAREDRRSGGGNVSRTTPIGDGYAARVRALLAPARSLDQAKRKLAGADTSETLKAEFVEASRRASGIPNEGVGLALYGRFGLGLDLRDMRQAVTKWEMD